MLAFVFSRENMVRHKLSALKVAKINRPGRYADGEGLYLQVTATLTKSWQFRYMRNRRARVMGLVR